MRQILDGEGRAWQAVAVPQAVAHLRTGAVLAFRPAGQDDAEPVLSTVTFNSDEAAAFAIRTMGEKELRRRLDWAKTAAGIA